MINNKPPEALNDTNSNFVDWDVESIINQVWTDLDGRHSRLKIGATVVRLLRNFDDATIRLYVPVVVRRKARELLLSTTGKEIESEEDLL